MWLDSDPSLRQIRKAFLQFVETFHQEHGFNLDFTYLAQVLEIEVRPATINKAFNTPNGEAVILLDVTSPPARVAFTGLHEISHHLFWRAHDGELKANLDDLFYKKPDVSRNYEEGFCYEAAALLLMPTHLVKEQLVKLGYSPLAVFSLSLVTGASHNAAMRRIIHMHDIPVHAVLLNSMGYVIDSFAYGKGREQYNVGKDFQVESEHPLLCGTYISGKNEEFKAAIPFKGNRRNWKSHVIAAQDVNTQRVLGFFLKEPPISSSSAIPLFDLT